MSKQLTATNCNIQLLQCQARLEQYEKRARQKSEIPRSFLVPTKAQQIKYLKEENKEQQKRIERLQQQEKLLRGSGHVSLNDEILAKLKVKNTKDIPKRLSELITIEHDYNKLLQETDKLKDYLKTVYNCQQASLSEMFDCAESILGSQVLDIEAKEKNAYQVGSHFFNLYQKVLLEQKKCTNKQLKEEDVQSLLTNILIVLTRILENNRHLKDFDYGMLYEAGFNIHLDDYIKKVQDELKKVKDNPEQQHIKYFNNIFSRLKVDIPNPPEETENFIDTTHDYDSSSLSSSSSSSPPQSSSIGGLTKQTVPWKPNKTIFT
jgi:hypothetical protein